MSLENALKEILDDSGPEKLNKLAAYLRENGLRTADDMRHLDMFTLQKSGLLDDIEIHKIINRKIPIKEAITEILSPGNPERIDVVTGILEREQVCHADELKYFDWNVLKELEGISDMEIKKIMGYVKKNFPEDYQEHAEKRKEELKLKRESELLEAQAEGQAKLAEYDRATRDYFSTRNTLLKDIDHHQQRYMDLKSQESNLMMDNIILSKHGAVLSFNLVLLVTLLAVMAGLWMAMSLVGRIVLPVFSVLIVMLSFYFCYRAFLRMKERDVRLNSVRYDLAGTEGELEQKRLQLDVLDASQTRRLFT